MRKKIKRFGNPDYWTKDERTIHEVANALKPKEKTVTYKATERYTFGWTDPRGLFGKT